MTVVDHDQDAMPSLAGEKIIPAIPAGSSPWSRMHRATAIHYTLAVSILSFTAIVLGILLPSLKTATIEPGLADKTAVMMKCIDKFSPDFKHPEAAGVEIGSAFNVCYSIVSSSLLAEEQENRNGSYVLQKSENIVLMWMVVIITVSGVILAGLQLLASYELAKVGKGKLAEGGNVSVKTDSVVVQSSVIGVVILTISFAFFMVFVVDVYRVEESKPPQGGQAAVAPDVQGNVGQGAGDLRSTGHDGPPADKKD